VIDRLKLPTDNLPDARGAPPKISAAKPIDTIIVAESRIPRAVRLKI